jgi:hypothetical protein
MMSGGTLEFVFGATLRFLDYCAANLSKRMRPASVTRYVKPDIARMTRKAQGTNALFNEPCNDACKRSNTSTAFATSAGVGDTIA